MTVDSSEEAEALGKLQKLAEAETQAEEEVVAALLFLLAADLMVMAVTE